MIERYPGLVRGNISKEKKILLFLPLAVESTRDKIHDVTFALVSQNLESLLLLANIKDTLHDLVIIFSAFETLSCFSIFERLI